MHPKNLPTLALVMDEHLTNRSKTDFHKKIQALNNKFNVKIIKTEEINPNSLVPELIRKLEEAHCQILLIPKRYSNLFTDPPTSSPLVMIEYLAEPLLLTPVTSVTPVSESSAHSNRRPLLHLYGSSSSDFVAELLAKLPLPMPDTDAILETFKSRYFEAKLQIRELEHEMAALEKKGAHAHAEEIHSLRLKIDAWTNREKSWIKKLTEILGAFKSSSQSFKSSSHQKKSKREK